MENIENIEQGARNIEQGTRNVEGERVLNKESLSTVVCGTQTTT